MHRQVETRLIEIREISEEAPSQVNQQSIHTRSGSVDEFKLKTSKISLSFTLAIMFCYQNQIVHKTSENQTTFSRHTTSTIHLFFWASTLQLVWCANYNFYPLKLINSLYLHSKYSKFAFELRNFPTHEDETRQTSRRCERPNDSQSTDLKFTENFHSNSFSLLFFLRSSKQSRNSLASSTDKQSRSPLPSFVLVLDQNSKIRTETGSWLINSRREALLVDEIKWQAASSVLRTIETWLDADYFDDQSCIEI